MRIVDLSREYYHRTPSYPGQPPIIHGVWKTHEEAKEELGGVHGNSVMFFSMPDHGGTHIDAPRHFGKDAHPDQQVSARVLHRAGHLHRSAPYQAARGNHARRSRGGGEAGRRAVPKKGTVLLCTGHHERTFPRKEYSTDNSGVNVAATEWLAKQGVVHFGIDSMRPGPEGMVNTLVHKACLELDITHIESLCNLEALLGKGQFQFIGLPLKFRNGTGSPIRAVAVFERLKSVGDFRNLSTTHRAACRVKNVTESQHDSDFGGFQRIGLNCLKSQQMSMLSPCWLEAQTL